MPRHRFMAAPLDFLRVIGALALFATVTPAAEPPTEWVDPDTGHRVIRLSREPGTASLYFHQNAYSADGKKLIVTNPHGIAAIDLATRAIDQLVARAGHRVALLSPERILRGRQEADRHQPARNRGHRPGDARHRSACRGSCGRAGYRTQDRQRVLHEGSRDLARRSRHARHAAGGKDSPSGRPRRRYRRSEE